VTFVAPYEGGRAGVPSMAGLRTGMYRPHIVIGNANLPGERPLDADGEYLGVAFTGVDREPSVGNEILADLAFIYFPKVSYDAAVPGATFTIREASRIVGIGEILETQGADL
jgi:hypothetical protein